MAFAVANVSKIKRDDRWFGAVQAAFRDQELCSRIWHEAHQPTQLPKLFEDIAQYVLRLGESAGQLSNPVKSAAGSHSGTNKKRKLEDDVAPTAPQQNGDAPTGITSPFITFECKDVSFQIPARKKLKLQLVSDAKDQRNGQIRAIHQTTDDVEYALPAEHIEQVFRLPVPEKQARQSHFAIFPKAGAATVDGMPAEQILFVLNETVPPSTATSVGDAIAEDDTYATVTEAALAKLLAPYDKLVVMPSPSEFSSNRPQSHRKGEKAYHVNAYRGSKEGYLFFLENGIVFGFKKPLAFFPFSSIESVSYTSVLQRTFNMVIAARESDDADVKEMEFSMLDQEDFAGIDDYVKKHGLNDASMAADRRAKAYDVNKEKKAELNGHAGPGSEEDGQSELQKAEQQLQEEEDEEEEDYEASGGESDGEGEESDEEEDDYGDGVDEEDAEGDEEDDAPDA